MAPCIVAHGDRDGTGPNEHTDDSGGGRVGRGGARDARKWRVRGRRRHLDVHRSRRQRLSAGGHHRWSRRRALVHQLRQRPDRPHHHRRRRHDVHRSAGNVDSPVGVTTGPDGALWFTSSNNKRIGRITTAGAITTFTDPTDTVDGPFEITAGPDGNLWFTSGFNSRIGRITTAGAITTFTDPAGNLIRPFGIAAGPDGNVWFTDFRSNVVGRITPAGAITTFTDPAGNLDGLGEIALGPDGVAVVHEHQHQPHRSGHDRRRDHHVRGPRERSRRPPRDRARSRRQPLVHEHEQLPHRSHHDRRRHHDVHRPGRERGASSRHHLRSRDGHVVREHQQRPDRTHRDHRPATRAVAGPACAGCGRAALYGVSSYTAIFSQSPQPSGASASRTNWNCAFSATRRRRCVADVGLEQQPDAELAARPVDDQTERPRGDATAPCLPLEPVADLGAVVLAPEAVDTDRRRAAGPTPHRRSRRPRRCPAPTSAPNVRRNPSRGHACTATGRGSSAGSRGPGTLR